MAVSLAISTQDTDVTDRQTDRQTDTQPRHRTAVEPRYAVT